MKRHAHAALLTVGLAGVGASSTAAADIVYERVPVYVDPMDRGRTRGRPHDLDLRPRPPPAEPDDTGEAAAPRRSGDPPESSRGQPGDRGQEEVPSDVTVPGGLPTRNQRYLELQHRVEAVDQRMLDLDMLIRVAEQTERGQLEQRAARLESLRERVRHQMQELERAPARDFSNTAEGVESTLQELEDELNRAFLRGGPADVTRKERPARGAHAHPGNQESGDIHKDPQPGTKHGSPTPHPQLSPPGTPEP